MKQVLVLIGVLCLLLAGAQKPLMAQEADFSDLALGPLPQAVTISDIAFVGHDPAFLPEIMEQGAERGYRFADAGVTVALPIEVKGVKIRLCLFAASEVKIEALHGLGEIVSQKHVQFRDKCKDVAVEGDKIAILRLTGGDNEASIVRLGAE